MRMLHILGWVLLAAVASAVEQRWEPMPLTTAAQAAQGIAGGEGCQASCTLVADATDGGLLLYGTDVGGVFRSDDQGASWRPNNLGMKSNGVICFGIDPRNRERVLAVGSVSGNQFAQADGLYLSPDGGRRWSHVLAVPRIEKTHDALEMVAWDASSYDAAFGGCRRVYASIQFSPDLPAGLFRSEDAGATWTRVAEAAAYGCAGGDPAFIAVHAGSGAVLAGAGGGMYRSSDRGRTFAKVADGAITGLRTLPNVRPDEVWATRGAELLHSADGGRTFAVVPQTTSHGPFRRLSVSPADPRRLASQDERTKDRLISHDGGGSWKVASIVHAPEEFLPDDVRANFKDKLRIVAWHPRNADLAWGVGPGDLLCRSVDGGLTWTWANSGVNNIMIGGLFNFSAQDPNILYFGSQDYNGGLTMDGGRIWRFVNLTISNTRDAVRRGGNDSDSWGWVYGGYSADGQVIFGGNREYNDSGRKAPEYDLWITFDGGKTSEKKVADLKGRQVSYSDPRQPGVLFCWSMRSADNGRTWARMERCEGVFIASAAPDRTLFGANGGTVVKSVDHGATWVDVLALPGTGVRDVAFDHVANRLWVAGEDNTLYRCNGPAFAPEKVTLPTDHFNSGMVASTVAIDPVDPRIVYVGACGTGLWLQRDASVARSLDGGATWERLTCNPAYLVDGWVTGAQMTSALRVHPVNRWLYAATCCYGWWRFPPPPADAVGKPVQDRRYEPAVPAQKAASVPDQAIPIPGPDGLAVKVIRDFGPSGVDYVYGPVWKHEGGAANVHPGQIDGVGCLIIDTTEHGGGGVIAGGLPITAQGQTHLVVRLRPLKGNVAGSLGFNIMLQDGKHGVQVRLDDLPVDRFSTVLVPLPGTPAAWKPLDQLQIQGSNFSGSARELKVAIDRIGTTAPPAGWKER